MPVKVDVFSPLPERWGLCQSCEAFMTQAQIGNVSGMDGLQDYPPEFRDDFQRLSDIIFNLSRGFGGSLEIRLYDPRSVPGLFIAIRHRIHRYPTFLISRQEKVTGFDLTAIENSLLQAGAQRVNQSEIERDHGR